MAFFRGLAAIAKEYSTEVYLVGGAVRDLLVGKAARDIDIMFSDEYEEMLARVLARWTETFPGFCEPKKPIFYRKYLTAKLPLSGELFPGTDSLDFSSARREVYPAPAAAAHGQPWRSEERSSETRFFDQCHGSRAVPRRELCFARFLQWARRLETRCSEGLARAEFCR